LTNIEHKKMMTTCSASSSSSTSSSAAAVQPATLTPADVTHAMNVPIFYNQTNSFWNMCSFLFTQHNGRPVWQQVPADTFFKMGEQLYQAVEALPSETVMQQKRLLFYQTYFTIISKTRGLRTQTEWLARSPPDFLQAMHKMYRLLFSMRNLVPEMPNFGNPHPALLKK
jgi:hypothetical protein